MQFIKAYKETEFTNWKTFMTKSLYHRQWSIVPQYINFKLARMHRFESNRSSKKGFSHLFYFLSRSSKLACRATSKKYTIFFFSEVKDTMLISKRQITVLTKRQIMQQQPQMNERSDEEVNRTTQMRANWVSNDWGLYCHRGTAKSRK